MKLDPSDLAELRPAIREIVAECIEQLDSDRDRLGYTEREAAGLLGIAPHKLRDARRRGEVAGKLVGKSMVYPRTELVRFLSSQK